jgi:hypothetical protein
VKATVAGSQEKMEPNQEEFEASQEKIVATAKHYN